MKTEIFLDPILEPKFTKMVVGLPLLAPGGGTKCPQLSKSLNALNKVYKSG